jgi:hypothetical protein
MGGEERWKREGEQSVSGQGTIYFDKKMMNAQTSWPLPRLWR